MEIRLRVAMVVAACLAVLAVLLLWSGGMATGSDGTTQVAEAPDQHLSPAVSVGTSPVVENSVESIGSARKEVAPAKVRVVLEAGIAPIVGLLIVARSEDGASVGHWAASATLDVEPPPTGTVFDVHTLRNRSVVLQTVVWRGENLITLKLEQQVACEVVLNASGSPIEGLLYMGVEKSMIHMGMKRAIKPKIDDEAIPIEGRANVTVDLGEPESYVVGHAKGHAPRKVKFRELPGYPWDLDPIVMGLDLGRAIRGTVRTASGAPVVGAKVLVASYWQAQPGGMALSYGPSFSRGTGGIWEVALTDEQGRFELFGLGDEVTMISARVQEHVMLSEADGITIARGSDCELELVVR